MSIYEPQFNLSLAGGDRRPIVLRFAEMFPSALARYEMHAARRGGNLEHVDPKRSGKNRLLIGDADWRSTLEQEIADNAAENFVEEVEALARRKREKERKQVQFRGVVDPWKASNGGPLREVILTAHRDWFSGRNDMDHFEDDPRPVRFEKAAVEWLRSRFGDMVVHARADHDEMTYHIHAIIAPWVEKTSTRRGRQRLLQPSAHPLLKSYEAAQDDVGAHFERIGLDRGQRTAAKRREVLAEISDRQRQRAELAAGGVSVPDHLRADADPEIPVMREHVPTPVWWAEEKERLLDKERRLRGAEKRLLQQQQAVKAQQAAVAARMAELDAREDKVDERDQEVTNVVQIIEAVAEGKTPQEAKAEFGISPLAARFIKAMGVVRGRMLHAAENTARKLVETELAAAVSFRERAEAVFNRLRNLVPHFQKHNFEDKYGPDIDDLNQTEKGLTKRPNKDRGEER